MDQVRNLIREQPATLSSYSHAWGGAYVFKSRYMKRSLPTSFRARVSDCLVHRKDL